MDKLLQKEVCEFTNEEFTQPMSSPMKPTYEELEYEMKIDKRAIFNMAKYILSLSDDPCKYCPFKNCIIKEYADKHDECCDRIAVYFLTQAEMAGEKPHNETKTDKK